MTPTTRPAHVAILDDDSSIRRALVRVLEAESWVVDSCATVDQLLDVLASDRPDCLILDLQLSGVSGVDVLKHLGQKGIPIPTIMLTAHEDVHSRDACLKAGAAKYLRKPVDAGHLIQTIQSLLA